MTQIPALRMIQIDIDPMMIAKSYPVEVGLWGNSSELIPKLTDFVKERKNDKYIAEIAVLKKEWIDLLKQEADAYQTPIRPQYIIKVLNDKISPESIIALDLGDNGWWFGRNFMMKQTQKMVMSGYLASMGFGLPSAMAAQLAYPNRQVICITGDGGFSMVMGDFLTAVKYKLPIKVFVFNNKQLGMIMQEQKIENYPNWQTDLYNCDFARYARICGGIGIKVTDPQKLEGEVERALSLKNAVIVDIDTDPRRFI